MEPLGGNLQRQESDISWQDSVHRPVQIGRSMPPMHTKSDYLSPGVYTSIGTSSAYHADHLPRHFAQGFFQDPLNAALVQLKLEAMEIRAVVLDHRPEVTMLPNIVARRSTNHLLYQLDENH
jgi:hypothetical protein